MPSAPNILFITADQLGARDLGCYGSNVDSTPVLDSLAREGVRFTRCYATHPVCAPNRATLLTGCSRPRHGLVANNYRLPPDVPTYAHLLRQNGYHTGVFGKLHQDPMFEPVPDNARRLGFDEAVVTEDPKWGPWLRWIRENHPDHYRTALAMCWETDEKLSGASSDKERRLYRQVREPFLKERGEHTRWHLMYPSPLPAELHDTAFITDSAIDFLKSHHAARPGRPFFCHVSYVDPHDPYDPPAPYATLFRPADMPRPIAPRWDPERLAPLRASQDFHNFHRVHDDPELVAQLRAYFHGSMRFIDDQIGRLVAHLREAGLADNTIVVFTSDHGEMLGDHGLITKGPKHYDRGIRCPLVVSGAGVARGEVSERLVCSLDFFPTFCDWAGVASASRPPLEGKSFAPACRGESSAENWADVIVDFDDVTTLITDEGWRYTRYAARGVDQLFDLRRDPDEIDDLAEKPGHEKIIRELQGRLIDALMRRERTPQYRAMPVQEDRRLWVDNFSPRPGPSTSLLDP